MPVERRSLVGGQEGLLILCPTCNPCQCRGVESKSPRKKRGAPKKKKGKGQKVKPKKGGKGGKGGKKGRKGGKKGKGAGKGKKGRQAKGAAVMATNSSEVNAAAPSSGSAPSA